VLPRDDDLEDDLWDEFEDERDLPFPLDFPDFFLLPNLPNFPLLGVGFLVPDLGLASPLDGFLEPCLELCLELWSVAGAAGPCMFLRLSATLASSCLRSTYFFAAFKRKPYDLSTLPTSAR
jgi:hypothetical protein